MKSAEEETKEIQSMKTGLKRKDENTVDQIDRTLGDNKFTILAIGECGQGKSTFLNKLSELF